MTQHLLHRVQRDRLRASLSVASVVALIVATLPAASNATGTLTTPRMYLNRQQANLTTGVTMQIFFTTGSAVSGGAGANKVILTFPSGSANDTKWCKTGSGTITPTGIANPTGATETATSLPGTLAGTCAQTPDTFTITGVDNLSATTKYGVQIVGNSSAIGTGDAANNIKVTVKTNNGSADVDTATLALSLIANDQVVVTATVDPTLTVVLSGNSVGLGTLSASLNSYSAVTSQVTTNAKTGYVSLVKYGATLTSGSNTIADVGGSPPDNMTVGTSAYGASTSKTSQTLTQFDSDSSNCDTTTRTTANPVSATPLTTTFQSFASAGAAVSSDTTTLCFLATISGTQAPGTYTSTSTLVTTAKF